MTPASDAAVAQAFREFVGAIQPHYLPFARIDVESLIRRAREIDAAARTGVDEYRGDAVQLTVCCGRQECGGECGNEWRGMEWFRKTDVDNAEVRTGVDRVEALAKTVGEFGGGDWSKFDDFTKDFYRRMARAAIAAATDGGEG